MHRSRGLRLSGLWANRGLVEGLSWQREEEAHIGAEAKIVHEVWRGEGMPVRFPGSRRHHPGAGLSGVRTCRAFRPAG